MKECVSGCVCMCVGWGLFGRGYKGIGIYNESSKGRAIKNIKENISEGIEKYIKEMVLRQGIY